MKENWANLRVPAGKAVKDVDAVQHVQIVHCALPVEQERPATLSSFNRNAFCKFCLGRKIYIEIYNYDAAKPSKTLANKKAMCTCYFNVETSVEAASSTLQAGPKQHN